MLRNSKGDICEDTSLLYRRASPMFSSLGLGLEPLAKEHIAGHSANTAKSSLLSGRPVRAGSPSGATQDVPSE